MKFQTYKTYIRKIYRELFQKELRLRLLTPLEEKIYNNGERLIPGVTHNWEEVVRHKSSYEFFSRIIENDLLTIKALKNLSTIDIIDLGCGVGHGCHRLSKIKNASVVGIDSSPESIEYAKQHYSNNNITYQVADLREFIPRMSTQDYAVSRGVFEHIPNGLKLTRSTKWRSRLLFDVPYDEPGRNPHHLILGIREDDFSNFPGAELFYQDLEGIIYDKQHKPPKPNMIICVWSNPDLPKISNTSLTFPIPALQFPKCYPHMLYQIKVMVFLKRILPLGLRRFFKRIILAISLLIHRPVWVLFSIDRLESRSSLRDRYTVPVQQNISRESKKHFLILTPWVIPGGSFRMTEVLMRHLSKKDFSFSVRYTQEPGSHMEWLKPYALDIAPLPLTWKNHDNESRVKALLKKHQCAGVLLIDIELDSFFFLPHFKKFSLPIINWLHFHTDTLTPYRQFIAAMGKFIDHTVVVNQEMKRLLLSPRYLGNNAQVSVITNGIDIDRFRPFLFDENTKISVLKKFAIPRGKPVISFISRFDEAKNPLGVVKIFEKIFKLSPDTYLVMAGEGHLFEKTKKKADRKHIANHVRFVGLQDDVRQLLTITSVFIAPSISESFGLSVAEAMAMEVPVVVSNVGGLKELVRDGVDGYRLDPSNTDSFAKWTVELIQNQEKRRLFGTAGRERIKNDFPIAKTIDKFEELLNIIYKERGSYGLAS